MECTEERPNVSGIGNHYMALLLAREAGSGAETMPALVLAFTELHHAGYLIGGAFFGVHLMLLGYLVYQASYMPRVLGGLLAVAAVGYLAESMGNFLFPGYEGVLVWLVAVPAVLAELSLALWLVTKGVSDPAVQTNS